MTRLHHPVLQVEPTDQCNLSCRMCAPHHEGWDEIHAVPKGQLDPDLWDRILEGLVADDVVLDHIIFQWLGDPSLHPELPRLIGSAARKLKGRVGYLRVDTNGIRLNPARISALLDSHTVGPDQPDPPVLLVVFTIDSVSGATYATVKGRDHLDLVRRHIRSLARQRRARGADCRVNIQVQFVVQHENAAEADAFVSYWSDFFTCQGGGHWHDEILLKPLSVGGGSDGQAAADRLYEQTIAANGLKAGPCGGAELKLWTSRPWQHDDAHAGPRNACPGLWLTPVIRHDGHLMMCCADLRGELDLGSLAEVGFKALWHSPKAVALREDHLNGRFEGVCAGCGGINWYEVGADLLQTTPASTANIP